MNDEILKDWRGTAITAGSIIVYPGRHSSSLWMTEATVLSVTERPTYRGPERVLVVLPSRTQGYTPTNWKPRKVTITAIDRVTVVRA
jgi:hypothetical protein